jgi:hypothetical protein
MGNTLRDEEWKQQDWKSIYLAIKYGECTPFLGAGCCCPPLPLGSEIALEWAQPRKFDYPLGDPKDLARVAQFVAVEHGPMRPRWEIKHRFEKVKAPDFSDPDEPHGILADLPFPIYITTNYDDFMVQALKDRKKHPEQEVCRWNEVLKDLKDCPSVFKREPPFKPDNDHPLVFHLHGHIGVLQSLVITEDDYLNFLVSASVDRDIIPELINSAFRRTSLLFLGYKLADWDFRVLFRRIVGFLDRSARQVHVSVQFVPVGDEVSNEERVKVQNYLNHYFGKHEIKVYWGKCREFLAKLKEKWEVFSYEK